MPIVDLASWLLARTVWPMGSAGLSAPLVVSAEGFWYKAYGDPLIYLGTGTVPAP